MSDKDLELLESYLDDELSMVQVDDLRQRLANEPELAELLADLRAQRDARVGLWASFEPSEHSVDLVLKGIRREMNRSLLIEKIGRTTRWAGSLAACVALGFVGGYLIRGTGPAPSPNTVPGGGTPVVQTGTHPDDGAIVWKPGSVRDLGSSGGAANGYLVSFTDDQGNLVGSQRFKTIQEAREFMRDFQLRQQQHKQLQNSGVKLIAEEQQF